MNQTDYPCLQVSIICVLLALIAATVIIEHPAWFGA
jgi:hypothetical protein